MAKLYEYAVIHNPKSKKKDERADKSELVVDVTRVLAKTEQEAVIHASRAIPEKYLDKLDEVEIIVRPF